MELQYTSEKGSSIRARARSRGIPAWVHIDLTWRCNLHCVHCYLPERATPELSQREVLSLLDELAEAGTLSVLFSGGEVLLRKDLLAIVEHARHLHFEVLIKTAGTLVTAEFARRLAQLRVSRVDISLYADQAEAHDAITGMRGSFARTLAAIQHLTSSGVRVRVVHTLMRGGATDFISVERLARGIGAEYQFSASVYPRLNGDGTTTRLNLPLPVKQALFSHPDHCVAFEEGSGQNGGSAQGRLLCQAGHTSCYISPFGEVWPCVLFPLPLGNVREQPFQKIWRESPVLQGLRGMLPQDLHTCSTCALKKFCSRCPGQAYLNGDLFGPSPVDCELTYARTGLRPAPLRE
jgi:radical SAM protein with 4Fe4S-binding SPASM domain